MASLDKLEGEAVEGVLLLLLLIIAFIVWKGWSGLHGFDPSKALAGWLKKIWNGMDDVFSKAVSTLTDATPAVPGGGADTVYTGTTLGAGLADVQDYDTPSGEDELDSLNATGGNS